MRIAALDQGTTSTRALVLDAAGHLHPVLSLTHAQHYPASGHVEQVGEELLGNLMRCLEAAEAEVAGPLLSGPLVIGLANQGESCLAWDARDGRPVCPVISWQDGRTAGAVAALADAAPEVLARAGLPLDAYFSASKLGWIVRHVPEAADLAARGWLRLGTTDAFFRDRLTGRFQTDMATASRTSLMNIATGAWDAELCRLFGVPMAALPAIGPTSGDLGGLPGGAVLRASIVDQQAALYGHGCRVAGAAKVTFGTGAFVQCVTGGLVRCDPPGPLPTVAWQRDGEAVTYALDGGVYAAGAAVDWARGLGLFADHAGIGAFAGPAAIDRGIAFVPALAGLGCPHWNRGARGAWLGLSLADGPGDLMQALLEGVALRTVEVLAAIAAVQPLKAALSVDGGLARNGYFTRFLAEVAEHDLFLPDQTEQTAAGVARMAAEAVGLDLPDPRPGTRLTGTTLTGGAPAGGMPQPARLARFAAARRAVEGYAGAVGESCKGSDA